MELPPVKNDRDRLLHHLTSCAPCRQEIAELRAVRELLNRNAPSSAASGELAPRLMAIAGPHADVPLCSRPFGRAGLGSLPSRRRRVRRRAIAATLAYQHFLMAPSRNSHAQRLRIVRRILREVPLVDGHNNYAWNVRKYAHSSLELHLSHDLDHKSLWSRPAWAQTDMERLKQGLVSVQVW